VVAFSLRSAIFAFVAIPIINDAPGIFGTCWYRLRLDEIRNLVDLHDGLSSGRLALLSNYKSSVLSMLRGMTKKLNGKRWQHA